MNPFSRKKSGILVYIGTLAILLAVVSSCVKQDFDEPPVTIPHVNFASNMTIATLKSKFILPIIPVADTANFAVDSTQTMVKVKGDIIIQGIVTANDESGNIYKQIYIQDSTGGICVSVDQVDMYTTYKVGQRMFIKCKGLYLGQYGTAVQIGYPYNGKIGRMPAAMIPDHMFNDSLPGKPLNPVVVNITSTDASYFAKLQGQFVRFNKVGFSSSAGALIAPGSTSSSFSMYDSADVAISLPKSNGKSLILYSSNYATFSADRLPSGLGSVQGIFTVYNSNHAILSRDTKDFVSFIDTLNIVYQNNFDASPGDWTIYTVKGQAWYWDSQYLEMTANGYLSGGTGPTDTYLISPYLNLTGKVNPILTFKMWTKYTDSGNPNPFETLISTNYSGTGDPTTATWTKLNHTIPAANSAVWTSSGDISLSDYNSVVYIAFHYRSSGPGSSTASKWEVDGFKLTSRK